MDADFARRSRAQEIECLIYLLDRNLRVPNHARMLKRNEKKIALLSHEDIRYWSTVRRDSNWGDRVFVEYSTLRSRST
jgi:hypothetical protein